ncbi:MAG TPA: hypothetical protein VH518_10225 [Tepidisphaeraceae bacterium]|jgi:hypothetical protein
MTLPIQNNSSSEAIPAVCKKLRTKTAFGLYDGDPDHEAWELGHSITAVYWCLCTMQTAGPDDQLVHPENCREGRTCYQARD